MRTCARKFLFFILAPILICGGFVSQPVAATDNFIIKDLEVEMELARDSEGRSILRIVETITADFPAADENHGLERVIVKEYDGHDTNLKIESVRDGQGNDLPYHWSDEALRIGDKDKFVHGLNTYQIAYSQRDVTMYYADTGKDEFYWDVIGLDWRVPIENASVRLTTTPDLRDSIQTELQCYVGVEGSTDTCEVGGEKGAYTLAVQDIGQYSGVTVALGFKPGTFATYQPSLIDRLFYGWIVLTAITTVLAVAVIIWLAVRSHRWTYRDSEIGTIIPEYLPPKNASVAVSASVSPSHHATLAAQLTDLAVRHYIQIIETREKSFWRPAEYDIKIVRDIADLRAEEQEILSDMFGHAPGLDERLALHTLKNNTTVYMRFSDNDGKISRLIKSKYGLKQRNEVKSAWFGRAAKWLLVFGIITLSPTLLLAWIIVFALGKTFWELSDEGLVLRRYLKGLDLYIKVAEKDRIKMLQSPEGAEKVGVHDAADAGQLVKLYERVLPYAILFGQEKEWSKRLGDYYENTGSSPDWYTGNTAFNAAVFGSMMSNFSTAASATSASSSSGGSGGSGSSGGGGGGGGGGGW